MPLVDVHPKKALVAKDTQIPMFKAALFTIGKSQTQPKCPQADEWIKIYTMVMVTYIQWNITQPLKRKKECHLQQHELGDYHTK